LQALTIQLILLLSLLLQLYVRPYTSFHLNMTENLAIIVSDITIYCGLYYLTQDLSADASWLFFTCMVLANAVFLGYWLYVLIRSVMDAITSSLPALGYFLRPNYFRDHEIERFVEQSLKANSPEMAVFPLTLHGCMRKMLGKEFPSFKSRFVQHYTPRIAIVSESRTLLVNGSEQKAEEQPGTDVI
jgi:hypothetical protein